MTPQRCPFCSFLHAFLGPPLHCSPNLSLPKRHRKRCIVCPATKGNVETPKWPPTLPAYSLHPEPPSPGGTRSSQTAKEALPSGIPVAPATYPSLFLRGSMPRAPLALHHRVWRKVRRGQDRAETSDLRNMPIPPCSPAGWERLLCSLCNCVAERLPRSCLWSLCVTGATAWGAGWGQGGRGSPFYIKGATSL